VSRLPKEEEIIQHIGAATRVLDRSRLSWNVTLAAGQMAAVALPATVLAAQEGAIPWSGGTGCFGMDITDVRLPCQWNVFHDTRKLVCRARSLPPHLSGAAALSERNVRLDRGRIAPG